MLGALTNHLWQSTIFALAAAILTLAFRKNRAQVRYWIWLAASLKFLVPFALLIALGTNLWQLLATKTAMPEITAPAVAQTILQITQPVPDTLSFAPSAQNTTNWLVVAVISIWACGSLAILLMRSRAWLRIRAAIRSSTPIEIPVPVEVRSAPGLLEPGVVGIFRPTLLLPEGILESLTPQQLEAVLAHELAHIRRRDNLTAAVHMLVEAIFWFHPLVWWIGARLIDERERACDEAVLSLGNQPRDYAEAILNVCRLYVESPLACVSGVTGTTVNVRVRAILAQRLGGEMGIGKKLVLATTCVMTLAIPIIVGILIARPTRAQQATSASTGLESRRSQGAAQQTPYPVADAATAGTSSVDYVEALGTVTATSVVVRPKIDGQLTSVNFKEGTLVKQGQVLAALDGYGEALRQSQQQLIKEQAQIDAAVAEKGTTPSQQAAIQQLREKIVIDQAEIQHATRAMSDAQVVAPITGVAGFLQVDIGNLVHSGQALVVINQLQPITAIFGVDQSYVPKILALQRGGENPTVELLDRQNRNRIAAGRLIAVDNEIDDKTDTVKLKAEFENKDGALFPNELVVARMNLKH